MVAARSGRDEGNDAGGAGGASGRRGRHRLRRVLVVLGLLVLVVAVYGVAVEPRFILDVEEEQAAVPDLPGAWEGASVGLISDLQIGLWLDNDGMVDRAVDRLVEADPAVALITGDFVYDEADTVEEVERAVDLVRPLPDAGIPTYAVLGNHDYASGAADELRAALEDAGVVVLENEAVALPEPGDADDSNIAGEPALHLVGIGPHLPGQARPEAALDGLPDGAPRLVMMHNPVTFDALPAGAAPVAVAGHTHGGQMRVPLMPEWSFLQFVQDHAVHADGWIDGYGAAGNHLYVNRGIGMSIVPARINCPPEVTLFTLARPAA